MGSIPPRLLLEGRPGVGKTTVALRLIEILQADGLPVTGFVTREVRGEGGRRLGFEIETVDGRHGLLAHVDLRGGPRVGRYGVALEDLERLCVPLLEHADGGSMVVVDELGKMALASARFRDAVTGVLARPLPLVATVHAFAHLFTDAIKRQRRCRESAAPALQHMERALLHERAGQPLTVSPTMPRRRTRLIGLENVARRLLGQSSSLRPLALVSVERSFSMPIDVLAAVERDIALPIDVVQLSGTSAGSSSMRGHLTVTRARRRLTLTEEGALAILASGAVEVATSDWGWTGLDASVFAFGLWALLRWALARLPRL